MNQSTQRIIDKTFDLAVIAKGIDGVLEVLGGMLLVLVKPSTINWLITLLTQHELIEDPRDLLSATLLALGHYLAIGSQTFASIYLLTHGLAKIMLVGALLFNLRWAYPSALVFFSLFVIYEVYRYTITFSPWLIAAVLIDTVVIVLIWLEYQTIQPTIPPQA